MDDVSTVLLLYSRCTTMRTIIFIFLLPKILTTVLARDVLRQYLKPTIIKSAASFSFFICSWSLNSSPCHGIGTEELTIRQKIIRQSNNVLAGPIFEAIRKIDQEDPDNIETESTNRYFLLLPIVDLYSDVQDASKLLQANFPNKFYLIKSILGNKKFDITNMKKTFNRYGDNIYYADPARANIYLAGGALPGTVQTEQYLLRNDIITNIGNLRADIESLTSQSAEKVDQQEIDDTIDDFKQTLDAFGSYLERTNPDDLKVVYDLFNTQKKPAK